MVLTDQKFKHREQDLREIGLRALIEKLGYADTLRFLSQMGLGGGDSVAWQQELFGDQSVEQIYEQAAEYWQHRQE